MLPVTKKLSRLALLSVLGVSLSACHFFSPPDKNPPINCAALKRQQLYNETNMNMETNDTTLAQRQALSALIAKNCTK